MERQKKPHQPSLVGAQPSDNAEQTRRHFFPFIDPFNLNLICIRGLFFPERRGSRSNYPPNQSFKVFD